MNRETAQAVLTKMLVAYRNTSNTNDFVAEMMVSELDQGGMFKPPKAVPIEAAAGTPTETTTPSAIALDLRNAAFKRIVVCVDEDDSDYTELYCIDCENIIETGMSEWSVSSMMERCLSHAEEHHG
jgi:hypothetical protein